MNHYNFHALAPNKYRNTKVVVFGLILLIIISGCVAKNNGVSQKDVIPISNITLPSNDFVNKDVRLTTLPILNVTDNKTLSIITSTLNNTNENVVKYISLISVLPEKELYGICRDKRAGCTLSKFTNGRLLDSKIYLSDNLSYNYSSTIFSSDGGFVTTYSGNTFNNTLHHEIGHVVYWYNVGMYGGKDEKFADLYASYRSPLWFDRSSNDSDLQYYGDDIKRLLIEQNQTINEMELAVNLKKIGCGRLVRDHSVEYAVCKKEYNNMTKEYVFLVETNLRREYVGLFYNKT